MKWEKETEELRKIILKHGLTEETKWRLPCFTLEGQNVLIIQPFKNYFAIMFFKGALLKDPKRLLKTPGVSQVVRQLRFTDIKEVTKLKPVINAYIKEAIKLQKTGKKVVLKKTEEFPVPEEFKKRLAKNKLLKKAFEALTPGRQRQYLFYFSSAKQSATREARVEKYTKQILCGKGMND